MGLKDKLKGFNWSTACTVGSCVGVIGTGIFSAIGGMKMADEWDPEKSLGEKFKIIFKTQWPAILCGAATIGLDILGHHLDRKTIAKLSAAVALGATQMADYRAEVQKEVGTEREAEIYKNSFDRVHTGEHGRTEVVHRFRDPYSNIFFDATMDDIYRGMLLINDRLWYSDFEDYEYVTLDLFYVGMGKADYITEDMYASGWTRYILDMDSGFMRPLNIWFEPKTDRLGRTYYIMRFDCEPWEDVQRKQRELEIEHGDYER